MSQTSVSDQDRVAIERSVRTLLREMLFDGRRIRDRRIDPCRTLVEKLDRARISLFLRVSNGTPAVRFVYFTTPGGNRLVGIHLDGYFNTVELNILEEIPHEERGLMT